LPRFGNASNASNVGSPIECLCLFD